MRAKKLEIACPSCGSRQIFYTCSPGCCFNHVCADCGTTFETATRATGDFAAGIAPPDPLPESSDPAAPCARCDSTAVYMTEEGRVFCGECGSFLELELTRIAAS